MHKTFIGGTSYNISRGKSLISGTSYNISAGKTLVNGTSYNIGFGPPVDTALVYSDNEIVFQRGGIPASGKTLVAKYSNITDVSHSNSSTIPWNAYISTINKANFKDIKEIPSSMAYWFANATNLTSLTGSVYIANVTTLKSTFYNCINLKISPFTGPNVKNMYATFYNCQKVNGFSVCGTNVTNFAWCYYNTNVNYTMIGNKVTNLSSTYRECKNLIGHLESGCPNSVTDMAYAYSNCTKLTGSPVCGPNVTNMKAAYTNCRNITGTPVCGPKVTDMSGAYAECIKLNGKAVCGNLVTNFYAAYLNCSNLTGSAVCGPNVIDMGAAYALCPDLSGSVWAGKNVQNMYCTYLNTWASKTGNIYILSPNVTNAQNCVYRSVLLTYKRINIYVPVNSTTYTTFTKTSADTSISGTALSWTTDTTNGYVYNSSKNLYIYPVENVEATMDAHGWARS